MLRTAAAGLAGQMLVNEAAARAKAAMEEDARPQAAAGKKKKGSKADKGAVTKAAPSAADVQQAQLLAQAEVLLDVMSWLASSECWLGKVHQLDSCLPCDACCSNRYCLC